MKMDKASTKASGDKSSSGPGFIPTMKDLTSKALFEGSAGNSKPEGKVESEYQQVTHFGSEK